ncbi:MAG: hypothetical protein WED34_10475 [Planctomycetales bacterium]
MDRSIPPVNPDIACIASTAGIYGKVSVIGLKEDGFDPLYRVKAKIFHTSPSPYDDPTDPLHPESDVTDGTRFPTIQTVEELDFNFQFVLEQVQPSVIDKRVPDAKHETGTEDSDNWLVIWYDFGDAETPRWVTPSVIRLNCRLIPFTDAEGNWYDSFEYGSGSLNNRGGELTPGGYDGPASWTITGSSGAKRAIATVGADSQAILTFDPGLAAFKATHKIHIPGAGGSGWVQMWALRSVRHVDDTHQFQWQIGHTSDNYKFHELVEWNGEDSFWRAAEEIDFDLDTEYDCELNVGDDDLIEAKLTVETTVNTLSYQSDEFQGETVQTLNAYYDGTVPASSQWTGFDKLQVRRWTSFPIEIQPAVVAATKGLTTLTTPYVDPRDQALVLCKLELVKLATWPWPSGRKYWRPTRFLEKTYKPKWRWTDVGKVMTGGKTNVSLYLVHGNGMENALKAIDGTDCVVVWHQTRAVSVFGKGEKLASSTNIKNLLALGGYKEDIFKDYRRDKVGTAVINEVRKKNVNRKFQAWADRYQGARKEVAGRINGAASKHDGVFTGAKEKVRLGKVMSNLHKRAAILDAQYSKAKGALLRIEHFDPAKPVADAWDGKLTIHGSNLGELKCTGRTGFVKVRLKNNKYYLTRVDSWSTDQIQVAIDTKLLSESGPKTVEVSDCRGNYREMLWF